MKKYKLKDILVQRKYILVALSLLIVFSSIEQIFAQGAGNSNVMNTAASKINQVLCRIAQLIFMVVGAIAALVVIMAGLKWTTSADDPGARNAAKTTIISVFVGLIIVMIAVYIVSIVIGGFFSGISGGGIHFEEWVSKSCDQLSQ